MAIRLKNTNALEFGTFTGVRITHWRIRQGNTLVVQKAFGEAIQLDAFRSVEFAADGLQLLYKAEDGDNAGLMAMLTPYFAMAMTIDLMTSTTAVVSTTGYASVTVSGGFTLTAEEDP